MMNTIERYFKKRPYETVLLDHTDGFKEKVIPMEIRTDRFTGRVTRVLKYRRRRFSESSHDDEFIEKSREFCPFCPENLEQSTPKFPSAIATEGRITYGQSTVLPNAFPYSQYCAITVPSHHHYIPLDRFAPEILFDALKASTVFIEQVKRNDAQVSYASINWNYMMASGGGLVHPHFQIVANQDPTRFHNRLIRKSKNHFKSQNSNYWSDLIAFEKQNQSRYLFNINDIEFISVFSPAGMFGEILAVFSRITSLNDTGDAHLNAFAVGLSRTLRCFHRLHLDHLNMTLFFNLDTDQDFWIQARIMPRRNITPYGTSDVNYFEKGHEEIIVTVPPEDLAEEVRNTK